MRTVLYMFTAAMSVTFVWLTFGILASCRVPAPVEPDVVVTESGPEPSCAAVADHLHALGCADAADAGAFVAVCEHVKASHLTPMDLRCMAAAADKTSARGCPGVSCP
jgi:hypothetical protein